MAKLKGSTTIGGYSILTPKNILDYLKILDGTGSGLDADLLDGLHASDFSRNTHNHDNAYLKLSGGTLTGSLKYSGGGYTGRLLTIINGDATGAGIILEGGGLTVVAAGESGQLTADNISNKATETLYLTSDEDVYILSNTQTGWASRKHASFRRDGHFYVGDHRVYHAGNKPTPADIGAAASSHGTHVSYGGNGSATTVSRSDHTHSYLPLSGGTLTGILKTNYELHMNGSTIKMNRPNTTGGWARGIDFKSTDGATSLGAIGMYGTNETVNNIYIGFGEGVYNGSNGLLITPTHLKFKNHNVYHAGNNPSWDNITNKPSSFTPASHNHDSVYLKLSGGTLTGTLTLHSSGIRIPTAGASWINGKTTNTAIVVTGSSESSYHPIMRYNHYNGNVSNIGAIGNRIGFWGYLSSTTENRTDASAYLDVGANTFYAGKFSGDGAKVTNVNAINLNGRTWDEGVVISKIASRDVNGDLHARLFRSTYANQSSISGAIAFRINNSSDNYVRFCSDPAAVRTWLGAAASSHGTHVSYGGNGSASTVSRSDHTHDDRYYTESEINTKLSTKLDVKSAVVNIDTETGTKLMWHRPSSPVGYPTLNSNAVGILSVNTHEGNYYTQLALDSYNNKLLLRSRHNTAWTSWVQLYTTQHKPTPADIGAAPTTHNHDYVGNSHLLGDFYNYEHGVLINTNQPAASSTMVTVQIIGNGYSAGQPINATYSFYDYNAESGIINASGSTTGVAITLSAFRHDGKVKIWFKQTATWQSYKVIISYGNRISSTKPTYANAAIPSGITNRVDIVPRSFFATTGGTLNGPLRMPDKTYLYLPNNYGLAGKDNTGVDRNIIYMDNINRIHIGYEAINNIYADVNLLHLRGAIHSSGESRFTDGRDYSDPWYGETCCIKGKGNAAITGWFNISNHVFKGWAMTNGNKYWVGLDANDQHFRVYDNSSTLCSGVMNLGSSNCRWLGIFLVNSPNISSDRRLKEDITECKDNKKLDTFYDSLKPVFYRMKNGNSGRLHYGFIAQEVEDAMTNAGMSYQEMAFLQKHPIDADGNEIAPETIKNYNTDRRIKDYNYALGYTELISINTHYIQKLRKENRELKERLNKIENILEKITNKLSI